MRRSSSFRPATLAVLAFAACFGPHAPVRDDVALEPGFGSLVARLSEPGGHFPSDNLVSNETSYLHVLGAMQQLGVRGGAYVGVGPDQNFSYIAAVRPEIAFIVDIRRDNLLEQLMFKALFENAQSRIEFLCMLTGRPSPDGGARGWADADISELVRHIDDHQGDPDRFNAASASVRASVVRYGYPLAEEDLATIRRIHLAFHQWGLGLRYSNRGSHPTYRQLLLQTDLDGNHGNYLADEESFHFVKELQRQNRVVPVVGDLAGPHALAAIGREVAERGQRITAFYVSNVEQYLMQSAGAFHRFAETVSGLPFNDNSVIIRSYFGRGATHPQSLPGHASTQLLERFSTFVRTHREGGYRGYGDLVTRNVLPLRGSWRDTG